MISKFKPKKIEQVFDIFKKTCAVKNILEPDFIDRQDSKQLKYGWMDTIRNKSYV